MNIANNKYQRYGLIGTLLFHSILFILFVFFGLTTPVPIPVESIVINFGNSNDGSGRIQPEQSANASKQQPLQEVVNPQPKTSPSTSQKAITQSNTEAISINDSKKKTNEKVEEVTKEPERQVNQNALFPGNKNSKNPSGEGETGKPGDQGDPNGSKNSTSLSGNYSGGGDSYELGVRKALSKTKPKYDCQESGKVVVEIKVDKNGNVVRATPGMRGTTNTAPCLMTKAEEAAFKTKWESDPDAPDLQVGRIIYNFVLN